MIREEVGKIRYRLVLEPLGEGRPLGRPSVGDHREGLHLRGDPQEPPASLGPVLAGMQTQPDGAQPRGVRGQQDVLGGGRTVLDPHRMAVAGCRGADNDDPCGGGDHRRVGVEPRDRLQQGAVRDRHEVPRPAVARRRGVHRGPEEVTDHLDRDRPLLEAPDAPPAENGIHPAPPSAGPPVPASVI